MYRQYAHTECILGFFLIGTRFNYIQKYLELTGFDSNQKMAYLISIINTII